LRNSPLAGGVKFVGTEAERAKVPPHKRLENAAPGCGLAIGNLSSQFFANVYLDALDQFVKHVLRVQRYVRYVDDFVLVHQNREQLRAWQAQIETFLRGNLRLELKADIKLKPLSAGCDFLGYVIYPTHSVVRRRVIGHARQKLSAWGRLAPSDRDGEAIRSLWASYQGHFRHANSYRLLGRLNSEFPWLSAAVLKC
jgi:RNA-directed DNA polymerase